MEVSSDVVLIGTGVAPLVTARNLIEQGRTVTILNPDHDFFLENSEFSIDPLLLKNEEDLKSIDLSLSLEEQAFKILSPEFPGAIERWHFQSRDKKPSIDRPVLKRRQRLWLKSTDRPLLESLYLTLDKFDVHTQLLEDTLAVTKFPGFSDSQRKDETYNHYLGVLAQYACDIDASRFRRGLLEFLREQQTKVQILCGVDQLAFEKDGLRFVQKGESIRIPKKIPTVFYWTPRLSRWVVTLHEYASIPRLYSPLATQTWSEWTIVSRDPMPLDTVGSFNEFLVYSEHEYLLRVLARGKKIQWNWGVLDDSESTHGSAESIAAITDLFLKFLKWDRIGVRQYQPRYSFEWNLSSFNYLATDQGRFCIVGGVEGFLVRVVEHAKKMSDKILENFA